MLDWLKRKAQETQQAQTEFEQRIRDLQDQTNQRLAQLSESKKVLRYGTPYIWTGKIALN